MNFFPSQMDRMGRRTGKILRRSKVPKGEDFLDDMDKYFEPKTERTTINPESETSETSSQLLARQNDSKDSLKDLLNFLEPESPIDDEIQKSFKALTSIKKKTSIIEGLSSDKKLYDILTENTFFNKLIKKNKDINKYNSDDDDKMSFPSTSSDEEKENFLIKTEHVDICNIDHLKEIKSLTQKYNNEKNKEIIEFIKSPSVTEIPLMPDKNKIEEIEKIAFVISEKIKNKLPENFDNINTKNQYENKESYSEIIEKKIDKNKNIEEIKEKQNDENIENNKTQKNKPEKPNSLIEIIENTKKSEQINNKTKKTKIIKQEKKKKKKTKNNDNVIISQETTDTLENKLNTDHQNTLIHDNLKYEQDQIPEYNDPNIFDNLPINQSNESIKNNISKSELINKPEIPKNKNKEKIRKKINYNQNEENVSESPKNTLKNKENKLPKQENYFKEEVNTNKPNSKNKKKNMKENNPLNIVKKSKSNPKKKGKEYTERELAIKAYNEILETGKTQLKQIIKTSENFGNEDRYPCRLRLPRICYWRSDPVFIEKNAEGKEVLNYYKLEEDSSLMKYLQPTKRSRGGTRKLKKNSKKTEIYNENPEIISEDTDSIVSLIKLKNKENREFGRNIYGPIFCTILKCQNFKLNVRFPDKLITLSRGDKFVIPPNTVYSMENLSNQSIVEISCKIMK